MFATPTNRGAANSTCQTAGSCRDCREAGFRYAPSDLEPGQVLANVAQLSGGLGRYYLPGADYDVTVAALEALGLACRGWTRAAPAG